MPARVGQAGGATEGAGDELKLQPVAIASARQTSWSLATSSRLHRTIAKD